MDDVEDLFAGEGEDEYCPTTAKITTMTMNHRATFAQPDVRTCFAPHFGHASALLLMAVWHSLHVVIAIAISRSTQ
ncbi:MAG: hypothetical protein IPP82_00635 [Xanthomonadales bacterium]|nr:hypothetical protein [Xanthomonadales bacterium]